MQATMTKQQPLVSVVTPVYNCAPYLRACIDSIVNQTYSNWEYVIIDNCSTDGSGEIASEYAAKERRIRVERTDEVLPMLTNWNYALRQLSQHSEYCKVVHADDWLFPACLQAMVEVASAHPSVKIVSSYRLDENEVNLDGLPYTSTVVPGRDIARAVILDGLRVFGSPSSILLRSSDVRARPRFYNESNVHADLEVCFDLLREGDFGFVHQILTFTRRHNETNTTFARRFDTYRMGMVRSLKAYGDAYLAKEELEARIQLAIKGYYRLLARRLIEGRDPEYWKFQKETLQEITGKFQYTALLAAAVIEGLDLPQTASLLKRRFTHKLL